MAALLNLDSIIFDLDGTLWDASATCTKAWNAALLQLGNESTALMNESTVRSFSGLKVEFILQNHFAIISKEDRKVLFELYKEKEGELMRALGGKLYPGVAATLPRLAEKYRLFIVSNCLAGYIENFLALQQLNHLFADFECSGNTGLAKSENIRRIVKRNNLQKPVYIGDTVWDFEAAKEAGVPFVHASYGFGMVENQPLGIEAFTDLMKHL